MNHEIHAPVLISTGCGFVFGVIEYVTTTVTKAGYTILLGIDVYGEDADGPFAECDVSELPAPSAYGSYGIVAAVERHPGYKWAIAESERRKCQPELPLDSATAATEGGVS